MRIPTLELCLCSALLFSCSDDGNDEEINVVSSDIEAKSGEAELTGEVTVEEKAGKITITVDVQNAPPGVHGVHLHQNADCTAEDATSAGDHWNPDGHMHGAPGADTHLGDLGNMTVDEDGNGTLTYSNAEWELDTGTDYDVALRALVIHEKADDLTTQPSGASGPRIGCAELD